MTKLEQAADEYCGVDADDITKWAKADFLAGARWVLEQMTSDAAIDMAMRAAFEAEHGLRGRKEQITAALAAVHKEIV